ncbi:hypothetical protein E5D57_012220 [Metarhizium anisopliae]|nr:hypothetical protein E5D57_012220 [Metarhizium anisopliae]
MACVAIDSSHYAIDSHPHAVPFMDSDDDEDSWVLVEKLSEANSNAAADAAHYSLSQHRQALKAVNTITSPRSMKCGKASLPCKDCTEITGKETLSPVLTVLISNCIWSRV